MNTEQAIAIFERVMRLRDPALLTPECCEIALEALREQAEREKGCEWCKIGLRFECYLVDDDGHTASIQDHVVQTVIADYCPVCGRRLEVEQG